MAAEAAEQNLYQGNNMRILKNKVTIIVLTAIILGGTIFFAKTKQTFALFGAGDITLVNLQDVLTEALKGAASQIVIDANEHYAKQFINNAMKKFKISDYQSYADDFVDKVYVSRDMLNKKTLDAYLERINVAKLQGKNQAQQANDKAAVLYKKKVIDAKEIRDLYNNNYPAIDRYVALASAGNPFKTTPGGRQFSAEDQAAGVLSRGQQAATLSIQQSGGYKDNLDCSQVNLKDSQTVSVAHCAVRDPANYITAQLNGRIQGLINSQSNPPDHFTTLIRLVGNTVVNRISAALFEHTSSNGIADQTTSYNTPRQTLRQDIDTPVDYTKYGQYDSGLYSQQGTEHP